MNKNVIITGASGGIGKSMVQSFAKDGYNIWACRHVFDKSFLEWTEELADKYNVSIKCKYFDLSSKEEIDKNIKDILSECKQIDVLINNAGISKVGLLINTSYEDIKKIFDINFFAAFNIIKAISKKMIINRKGVIINIASVAGLESQAGKVAYASSKAALIKLTQCLAKELGPLGIRVNAIAPGPIETEMLNQYSEEEIVKIKNESSLKRLGHPEEISQVALFLSSDKGTYINGSIITVDGGR